MSPVIEGSGSIAHGAVTVTTTASVIRAANDDRVALTITNLGSATIYIGGSTVTAANGHPIVANGSYTFEQFNGAVYGIIAAATADVRYLDVG